MFHIYLSSEKVARTKSTARPMTSEELVVAGAPPTEEDAPPSAMIRLLKLFAIPAVAKMERLDPKTNPVVMKIFLTLKLT
jgi:hypothetical protein